MKGREEKGRRTKENGESEKTEVLRVCMQRYAKGCFGLKVGLKVINKRCKSPFEVSWVQ